MEEAGYRTELRETLNKVTDLNERLIERLAQLSLYINRAGLEVPPPDAGRLAPIVALKEPEQYFPQKRLRTGEHSNLRYSSQLSPHVSVLEGKMPAYFESSAIQASFKKERSHSQASQRGHNTHNQESGSLHYSVPKQKASQSFVPILDDRSQQNSRKIYASNTSLTTPSMVPLDSRIGEGDAAESSEYEVDNQLKSPYEAQQPVQDYENEASEPYVASEISVNNNSKLSIPESFRESTHLQQPLEHYHREAPNEPNEHVSEAYREESVHGEPIEAHQPQTDQSQAGYIRQQEEDGHHESENGSGSEFAEYNETSVVRYPPSGNTNHAIRQYHYDADLLHQRSDQSDREKYNMEMMHCGNFADASSHDSEAPQPDAHQTNKMSKANRSTGRLVDDNYQQHQTDAESPVIVETANKTSDQSVNLQSHHKAARTHDDSVSMKRAEASPSNDVIMLDDSEEGEISQPNENSNEIEVVNTNLSRVHTQEKEPESLNNDTQPTQLASALRRASENDPLLNQNSQQETGAHLRSNDQPVHSIDVSSRNPPAELLNTQLKDQHSLPINFSSQNSQTEIANAQSRTGLSQSRETSVDNGSVSSVIPHKSSSVPDRESTNNFLAKTSLNQGTSHTNNSVSQPSAAARLLQAPARGLAEFVNEGLNSPHTRHSAPSSARPSVIPRHTAVADHSLPVTLEESRRYAPQSGLKSLPESAKVSDLSNVSSQQKNPVSQEHERNASPVNTRRSIPVSTQPSDTSASSQPSSRGNQLLANRTSTKTVNEPTADSFSRLGDVILNNERIIAEKSGMSLSNQVPKLGKLAPPAVIMRSLNRIPSPSVSNMSTGRGDNNAGTSRFGPRASYASALGNKSARQDSSVMSRPVGGHTSQSNLVRIKPKSSTPHSVQSPEFPETNNSRANASKAVPSSSHSSVHEESGVENILNPELLEYSSVEALPSQSTPAKDITYSSRLSQSRSPIYTDSRSRSTPNHTNNSINSRNGSRLSLQSEHNSTEKNPGVSISNSDMFMSALSSFGPNDSVRGKQSQQQSVQRSTQSSVADGSSASHSTLTPSVSYQVQNMPGAWPRTIPREANIQSHENKNAANVDMNKGKRVRSSKRAGHIVENVDDSLPDLSRVSTSKNLDSGNSQR